jgi:hypothetical protein
VTFFELNIFKLFAFSRQTAGCPFKKGCPLLSADSACPYLKKGGGCTLKGKAEAARCPFFKQDTGCPFYFRSGACPLKEKASDFLSVPRPGVNDMTGDFRQFPANKMASFLKPNVITIFS